jgi:hypothetical protein
MNTGRICRQALRTVSTESLESRILVTKKIIRELEDVPGEVSHRLCADLRAVLKSVTSDPSASAETLYECGSLLARVRKLDPRRNSKGVNDAEPDDLDPTAKRRERVKSNPPASRESDGYQPGFIIITESLFRVSVKYPQKPKWTQVENETILTVALGNIPLEPHAAQQLWLAFGYDWKRLGGCFEAGKHFSNLMSPQAGWIQDAICSFANCNEIPLPTPNIFSITDDIAWRS